MEKTRFVFVILVYRNTGDLAECIESIERHVKSFRIVVVNAFYDGESMNKAEGIARLHRCEFLNIENKGYSYGNNRGVELANKLFDYEYLVISNPDIVIELFDDEVLRPATEYDIIAPRIVAASGKEQNPMAIKKNRISQYIQYVGFKNRCNLLVYLGVFLSKAYRWVNQITTSRNHFGLLPIYEAHGSFVIISKKAERVLYPIYDENMFLFAEEGVLASKAQKSGLKTFYYEGIRVMHKEDGSMKLGDIVENEELRKANIYCYEHYE